MSNVVNTPKPTGEYKVGTSTFVITSNREEKLGPKAGKEKRIVAARVYYPVREEQIEGMEKSVVVSEGVIENLVKAFHVPDKGFRENKEGEFYKDVKPSSEQKFPLVVFSHGYQSYIESNNFSCIDLCSHGYVVLSVGHTYEAAGIDIGDGSIIGTDMTAFKKMMTPGYIFGALWLTFLKGDAQKREDAFRKWQTKYVSYFSDRLPEWQADTLEAIEELKKRYADIVDFDNIGAMGHSFGGNTAYYMCHKNPEIKCCLNLDGGLFGNYDNMTMHKPVMQITSGMNKNIMAKVELDTDAPVYIAEIGKVRHMGLCDTVFLVPMKSVVGSVPAKELHSILCENQLKFFDKYLKGAAGELSFSDTKYVKYRQVMP